MRTVVRFFKSVAAASLLAALCAVAAQAQGARGKLQIESLDHLAPKASEAVSVSMDEWLLRIVPPLLSKDDPDERKAAELIAGLKGIYVRSFEFDREGAYTEADVAPIREQLRAPGWTRAVLVRSRRRGHDNVEIYLLTEGSRVEALAVLSAEPKELTVVNILGSIDLEKLKELGGKLGIPHIEIGSDDGKASKPPTKKKP